MSRWLQLEKRYARPIWIFAIGGFVFYKGLWLLWGMPPGESVDGMILKTSGILFALFGVIESISRWRGR